MKLIHYTIRKLSVVMIIILTAWAALFSFNIFEEVWDETDDSLENFKILIIRQFMQDTTTLNLGDKDLMSQYHIREITEKEAIHYKERYFDSTRFYETELEFDPIRVLKTAFRGPNSKFYELTIQMSTLEKDDMIRAMLTWVIILYFVLFICLITISNIVFRKSWKPFYKLMNWLNQFTPGSQIAPLDNPTRVNEFKQLNTAIQQMAQRSEDMYAKNNLSRTHRMNCRPRWPSARTNLSCWQKTPPARKNNYRKSARFTTRYAEPYSLINPYFYYPALKTASSTISKTST